MIKLLKQCEVNSFLESVEKNFPNFVAACITDEDGFPIATKISKNVLIKENEIALTAIARERDFIKNSKIMKVKRELDTSKHIKMIVLLTKSNRYLTRFKGLNDLINSQTFF